MTCMIADPSPVMRTSTVAGTCLPSIATVPSQLPTSDFIRCHSGVCGTADIFIAAVFSTWAGACVPSAATPTTSNAVEYE